MTPAPLLLIVGMHRSGTSLLGALLSACGIAMPGPLIDGDTHNPEGYFERADVTALQEQLLIDLERWWPAPRGMQALPEGWLNSQLGEQALEQLMQLLQTERHSSPWAIKDPRSSLLVPLWQAACQRLGIPLQLVLAVRDPSEVSVSLVRRDQAITGMDGWRAQRLWWHHNAAVLQHGAHLSLHVLHYSHWFDPAQGLRQLHALVPAADATDLKAILATTVNPAHRRSHREALPCALDAAVMAFNRRLEALAIDSSQRDLLLHWLQGQPELPDLAPLPHRGLHRWFPQPRRKRVTSHPWGYVAELVCGSEELALQQQLEHWRLHGFEANELERFAALPAARPCAEPWDAAGQSVAIQVRGEDPQATNSQAWLAQCPLQSASSIQAVSFGATKASAVALNLADVIPGPVGAAELLQLAQLERVWDPIATRVQLLRQLGVKASWLPLKPSAHQGPRRWPNATTPAVQFLIAGVQKGGTTALAAYLRQHPQLFIPATKELHFFDDESLNWQQPEQLRPHYHAPFKDAPEGALWGEATPIYSYWWPAMARIWSYNPGMRFILCLRNPIERAYSHWAMETARQWDTLSFPEAIALEEERCRAELPQQHRVFSYVSRGFYSEQLRRLWNFFPREQTLILRQEQLLEEPALCLKVVHSFLGVEPLEPPEPLRANNRHYQCPMDSAVRGQLNRLFKPEIEQLEEMLDWDLGHWFVN